MNVLNQPLNSSFVDENVLMSIPCTHVIMIQNCSCEHDSIKEKSAGSFRASKNLANSAHQRFQLKWSIKVFAYIGGLLMIFYDI